MESTSDHHSDVPPIDVSNCVKVTTVAAETMVHAPPADTGNSGSLESSNPEEMKRLQRRTRNFTETDIKDFAAFIEQGMTESIGLVLVFIENWHNWAFESLINAFPSLPVHLLHGVSGGLSLTMLPAFDDDNIELYYIMDNIDVTDTPERTYSRGSMRLGLWEAQRMPVAAWVKRLGAFPQFPQRAVTVVFGQSPTVSVSDRLFGHYDSIDLRRWKRLNECPYWIYFDSFFVFNNWDSTLEVARFYLESKERDMFSFGSQSPIFHQTRELHRDTSTTLALQECIRMHRASLKSFRLGLGRMPPSESLKIIQRRLEDIAEQLEFYQSTCLTVLEQQRNLLNMMFNLETISQSQAVMRLNGLAFVFLPLSFIASIFGMTTITTPAVWYIAVALPTLIATVGAVFIINRATDYLHSRKIRRQQKDRSGSHRGINWNIPRSWLAKITNTSFGGSTASNTASLDKALSSSLGPPSQERPEHSIRIFDEHSPDQQRPEASTRIVDRQFSDQQQHSTGVLDIQCLSEKQPEASPSVLDRQSPDQRQPEPVAVIFDIHPLNQKQLEPAAVFLDIQSLDQKQPEPIAFILDIQPPDQQLPDQQSPDEQSPDEQSPDEQPPDQQPPDQQLPDQQPPDQQPLEPVTVVLNIQSLGQQPLGQQPLDQQPLEPTTVVLDIQSLDQKQPDQQPLEPVAVVLDIQPPDQQQHKPSTRIPVRAILSQRLPRTFPRTSNWPIPGQRRPEASPRILNIQPPDQHQLKLSTRTPNRLIPGQRLPRPSKRTPNRYIPGQKQPVASPSALDMQSPGQRQPKRSARIIDEPAPYEQEPVPLKSLFDEPSPFEQEPKPSTDVFDKDFWMTIDSDITPRQAMLCQGPSRTTLRAMLAHESPVAYGYRVTGVARVDSN